MLTTQSILAASALQIPHECQRDLTVTSGSIKGKQEPDVGFDAVL